MRGKCCVYSGRRILTNRVVSPLFKMFFFPHKGRRRKRRTRFYENRWSFCGIGSWVFNCVYVFYTGVFVEHPEGGHRRRGNIKYSATFWYIYVIHLYILYFKVFLQKHYL